MKINRFFTANGEQKAYPSKSLQNQRQETIRSGEANRMECFLSMPTKEIQVDCEFMDSAGSLKLGASRAFSRVASPQSICAVCAA